MKKLHLLCNAHLDPVWLWQWEEGAAEAIATFRIACDFCEQNNHFIFNHNEAVLYEWVEEYDPALFERIRKLVQQGKWRIMGGWYIQPDCNMPGGESLFRQIEYGRAYFKQKFNAAPTTAINFDSFGHARGLVQILKLSGFDSYIFMRPQKEFITLPDDFYWQGYDGSEILATRLVQNYGSQRGKARSKAEEYLKMRSDKETGLLLWGIGNHGGGPSKEDLSALDTMIGEQTDLKIVHSAAEDYFADLRASKTDFPRYGLPLNPWGQGCYTSQMRIKQNHRALENELYRAEKTAAAALSCGMDYPQAELKEAEKALLFSEFHDILPGSSVESAETASLRLMQHGRELCARVQARAFFALTKTEKKAETNAIPVFAYNPHPYPVRGVFECEFQLADMNWEHTFTDFIVTQNGAAVPAQVEREESTMATLDWRKKIAVSAELAPYGITRFDCMPQVKPQKPALRSLRVFGGLMVKNSSNEILIGNNGLIKSLRQHGRDIIKNGGRLIVLEDNTDPWGMLRTSYDKIAGSFRVMNSRRARAFSGALGKSFAPVHVIENGACRTVIEAFLEYKQSVIVMRYSIPKTGAFIDIDMRIFWAERARMLKLEIPCAFTAERYIGDGVFGFDNLKTDGTECAAQKWVRAENSSAALAVLNRGTYGSDFRANAIRMTVLRSPMYAGHPLRGALAAPDDRYMPHSDMGERSVSFRLLFGSADELAGRIAREALAYNEQPYLLSFFPSGNGDARLPFLSMQGDGVIMSSIRPAAAGNSLNIRLVEMTGQERSIVLSIPNRKIERTIAFKPHEIKSIEI